MRRSTNCHRFVGAPEESLLMFTRIELGVSLEKRSFAQFEVRDGTTILDEHVRKTAAAISRTTHYLIERRTVEVFS
jgi:hypothetical protein